MGKPTVKKEKISTEATKNVSKDPVSDDWVVYSWPSPQVVNTGRSALRSTPPSQQGEHPRPKAKRRESTTQEIPFRSKVVGHLRIDYDSKGNELPALYVSP